LVLLVEIEQVALYFYILNGILKLKNLDGCGNGFLIFDLCLKLIYQNDAPKYGAVLTCISVKC
jgi:hypothetical protein